MWPNQFLIAIKKRIDHVKWGTSTLICLHNWEEKLYRHTLASHYAQSKTWPRNEKKSINYYTKSNHRRSRLNLDKELRLFTNFTWRHIV